MPWSSRSPSTDNTPTTAASIHVARDILAHVDLKPIISQYVVMRRSLNATSLPERKEEAQAFLAAVGVGTGNDV
jgi:hypothetical protein